jgi:hypothetical protein
VGAKAGIYESVCSFPVYFHVLHAMAPEGLPKMQSLRMHAQCVFLQVIALTFRLLHLPFSLTFRTPNTQDIVSFAVAVNRSSNTLFTAHNTQYTDICIH